MKTKSTLTFGDNVRVLNTPLTVELGFAGLSGQIYGETTPSVTDVTVIGELTEDYAVNVQFSDKDGQYWFASQLLEFVDHAAGTEISIGTGESAKSFTRSDTAEWVESRKADIGAKKAWWRFW